MEWQVRRRNGDYARLTLSFRVDLRLAICDLQLAAPRSKDGQRLPEGPRLNAGRRTNDAPVPGTSRVVSDTVEIRRTARYGLTTADIP